MIFNFFADSRDVEIPVVYVGKVCIHVLELWIVLMSDWWRCPVVTYMQKARQGQTKIA